MTHSVSPNGFESSWNFIRNVAHQNGRDTSKFGNVLYHHININEDRGAALADAKPFLDQYYGANYSKERLESWLTYGSPRECINDIKRYCSSGCDRMTFRLSTMGNPRDQLKRLGDEVLPHIND